MVEEAFAHVFVSRMRECVNKQAKQQEEEAINAHTYTDACGFLREKSVAKPRSDIRMCPFSSSRILAGCPWVCHAKQPMLPILPILPMLHAN